MLVRLCNRLPWPVKNTPWYCLCEYLTEPWLFFAHSFINTQTWRRKTPVHRLQDIGSFWFSSTLYSGGILWLSVDHIFCLLSPTTCHCQILFPTYNIASHCTIHFQTFFLRSLRILITALNTFLWIVCKALRATHHLCKEYHFNQHWLLCKSNTTMAYLSPDLLLVFSRDDSMLTLCFTIVIHK